MYGRRSSALGTFANPAAARYTRTSAANLLRASRARRTVLPTRTTSANCGPLQATPGPRNHHRAGHTRATCQDELARSLESSLDSNAVAHLADAAHHRDPGTPA